MMTKRGEQGAESLESRAESKEWRDWSKKAAVPMGTERISAYFLNRLRAVVQEFDLESVEFMHASFVFHLNLKP